MRFNDWLDAERGRASKVAEHFGVTLSAVSQWKTNGVPVEKMLGVHELTDREVSLEELLARDAPSQAHQAATHGQAD
jgi:phage terminase Nu1 subunit (DNA packaging protein)